LLSKQIARRLEITERTVKAHRHSLMEKTEVDSVAELVELALIAGVEPKH
jgi:DNA-binding CsgD family transcriptional regulator